MLTKYASPEIGLEVLDVQRVPANAGHRRLARARRQAHRAVFDYTPRPGYIYVRSRAISSRCNDNFDEFPAEEIKTAYRSFVGKPVFVNHHNSDHRRARGVIIDAALHEDTNPDGSPDTWAEVLMEVDAKRFPVLAREVLAGNIARTSMGTDVEYSVCTACGNKAYTPADYCQHIPRMKGMKLRRFNAAIGGTEEVLIAERCYGLRFFENSLLVEDPADPTAFGWVDFDASGLSTAAVKQAAREVIDEAERYVSEAADPVAAENQRRVASLQRVAAVEKGSPEYKGHYNRGWSAGTRGSGLEAADARNEPEAWYDGYMDASVGRPKWSLMHHPSAEAANAALDAGWTPPNPRSKQAGQSLQTQAYGETKAPAKVDTMRAEACPVCGDDEGFSGEKCNVCGYTQPPSQFRDPDLSKAREVDLRQEQAEQAGADPADGINTDGPVDAQAPGQPGQDDTQNQTLECTNCGEVFSAEGDAATSPGATEQDPAQATPPEADPQHPDAPEDPDSQKAQQPDDLSDLADASDRDLGLEDDEDREEDDPDQATPPDATGEGRVTPETADDAQKKDPAPVGPGDAQDPNAADPSAQDPSTVDPNAPDQQQDPNANPLDGVDGEIAPNMTCPVCGEGTLVPVAPEAGDEDLDESGQVAPKPPPAKPKADPHVSRHSAGIVQKEAQSQVMSKETVDMNQPNPAQQKRNRIIAAIREQQGLIETIQQENIGLRNAVATLAVAARVDNHPAFAPIVRAAGLQRRADSAQNPDGAPATTTEEAKQPQATDDVNSVGAAPGEVNKDVTPEATTDVQNSNVAADAPVLDNLQSVTAPVSGTDAPTPDAGNAESASQVSVGTPSNDTFDSKTWTSAKNEQARFVASLRLARLQIEAGLETGEDLALGQRIAESKQSLGEIEAQVNVLSQVASRKASAPTADQQRRLVPRSANRQGIVPVSLTASTQETREGEDEWMIG